MLKTLAITLLAATFMTSGIAFGPFEPGLKQMVVVAPGKADRQVFSRS